MSNGADSRNRLLKLTIIAGFCLLASWACLHKTGSNAEYLLDHLLRDTPRTSDVTEYEAKWITRIGALRLVSALAGGFAGIAGTILFLAIKDRRRRRE